MGGTTVKARKRKIGQFSYKKNWRQVSKKRETRLHNPAVDPKFIEKNYWDKKKNAQQNFDRLGLIFNLNKAMKPPSQTDEEDEETVPEINEKANTKDEEYPFISTLERKAQKPKPSTKIPPRDAKYIMYLLDKYGENYKAMALDSRNYDQDTWKQLRRKVQHFKNCTDQYAKYLKRRKLMKKPKMKKPKSKTKNVKSKK